jgi:alpha-1,3-glucan synthase
MPSFRYPAMWGLSTLESLPNPNPQDFGDDMEQILETDAADDNTAAVNKRRAQQWAGLQELTSAVLIVFVGRWSAQKGVDLIADLAPRILERYQNVQMICVGPIIDLHGKLAAQKLERVAQLFPGRLFSKPEFTAVPEYVIHACDFVLIPSRDEPFGLVAVEFGRSGALGIGAYVGGLGSMPGWWDFYFFIVYSLSKNHFAIRWFPIESSETSHLLDQFWEAIQTALSSSWMTRKAMRRQSKKQRFPVHEWLDKLDALYSRVLKHGGYHVVKRRRSITMEMLKMKDILGFSTRSKLIRSGLPELESPEGTRALRLCLHLRETGVSMSHIPDSVSQDDHEPSDTTSSLSEVHSSKPSSSLEVDFTAFQVGDSSIQNLEDWRLNAVSDIESASDTIHHVDSKLDMSGVMPRELMNPQSLAAEKQLVSLEEISEFPNAQIRVFEQFNDQSGKLSQVFERKLDKLCSENSVKSLCIEKTLKNVRALHL